MLSPKTTGVLIHLLRFLPSLLPNPSWALGAGVTTSVGFTMMVPAAAPPYPPASGGVFYGGVDGSLLYGAVTTAGVASLGGSGYCGTPPIVDNTFTPGPLHGAHASSRFYKLKFPTYDGAKDPLNWLNHYEQFF
jgi:hypothetical protein